SRAAGGTRRRRRAQPGGLCHGLVRTGIRRSRSPSVAVDGALRGRLVVEVLLEHLQGGGSRCRAPVAAVLDHRADDKLRRVVRAPSAPPRLTEQSRDPVSGIDGLLGGAGLAGNRYGKVAEDGGGRPDRKSVV